MKAKEFWTESDIEAAAQERLDYYKRYFGGAPEDMMPDEDYLADSIALYRREVSEAKEIYECAARMTAFDVAEEKWQASDILNEAFKSRNDRLRTADERYRSDALSKESFREEVESIEFEYKKYQKAYKIWATKHASATQGGDWISELAVGEKVAKMYADK